METLTTFPSTDTGILQAVRDAYSAKAKAGADSAYSNKVAKAFGYTAEDLNSAPLESHMGLSCGNPVAVATLREGEKVLDLGSGGGIDIFLAAAKVKDGGQAIGLDGSEPMIERARRNANRRGLHPPQVAFVHAELTQSLPILSNSIDCVLSNCVINLLPQSGKINVFKEIFRVLKPGGRVNLSDIVAKKPLPDSILNDLASYVGCISGAIQTNDYKEIMAQAGLKDVIFVDTMSDLNVYLPDAEPQSAAVGCCLADTKPQTTAACCQTDSKPQPTPVASSCCSSADKKVDIVKPKISFDTNDWVASCQIYAVKPSDGSAEISVASSALLRWWDAYPLVKSTPTVLPRSAVALMVRDPDLKAGKDFSIIDVRSDGHKVAHVVGSFQWTAESFHDRINEFAQKFATVSSVVFYCSSSKGRAPRCAGWYQDYLNDKDVSTTKAFVLEDGIKGWVSDPDLHDLIAE